MALRTIEVPLQQEQVLEVVCNDLPNNPTELTDIFRQEGVALDYYRLLAVEYYEQQKIKESMLVLQAGLATASHSPLTQPRQKLPLLTLIATLHMRLARATKDSSTKQKHLEEATQFINEADRIHNQYEQTFVVKGNLYLLRRDINEAFRSFNMVLERRPNCTPALLGKAKIQYHLRQYKQALQTYQSALVYSRGKFAAVEIRLGIAQCFAQLQMYEQAKAALKRCLELEDRPNATVLIMLAVIELNESKNEDLGTARRENSLRNGLQHMQEAHRTDKLHPVALNMLASHFFLTSEFEQAFQCTKRALNSATSNVVKADTLYQIARTHHQMQQYDEAFKFYRQCIELNPDHVLGQCGLGQMHLQRGEHEVSITIFEKLHHLQPKSVDIMKVLGSLYAMADRKEQALALFNKVLEKIDDDALLAIEVGQLHEDKHNTQSLKCNLNEAENYYNAAIEECEKISNTKEYSKEQQNRAASLQVTMTYNLARLYEEQGDMEKAKTIYKRICADYPAYHDAHLRLGLMEQELGHPSQAIEYYKEVFDSDPNNATAWTLIGQAQAMINEKLCKRSFEKVLKECDKNDLYTHIALGNYHAATAREMKSEKYRSQREDAYKLALNFYTQALKRDPKNSYAANGLAIILAENGEINQAKKLLNEVRETMDHNPSIFINLAHCHVELKQYREAIIMYERASRRFQNNPDTNLLLCLARTQFISAKAEKNPTLMYSALLNTQKALHNQPSDKSTLYDIALVQQSYAQLIADLSKEERTVELMQRALDSLDSSQRTFRMLVNVPAAEFVLYDRKITEQRERYGETLRTQLNRKMIEQKEFAEEEQKKTKKIEKQLREKIEKKAAEEKERLQEQEEARMRLEEERRRIMEKVHEDNRRMADLEREVGEVERKTRKRENPEEEEEEGEEEGEGDDEPRRGKKKIFRSKQFIEDSDEE
ncbi:protein required for normal CLN1 and CLN2 G1 cyclin expression [Apophysomyces sp. BC1034]|nr:protein required for normal CLN1 and CLN2 G1 cyclin expression [Apophysomyces sp. BC1015]KAG0185112.1 protein required for normal CLN1 and CLN2 G1 cyclin expression [Apophysomyces sp. BC1034]